MAFFVPTLFFGAIALMLLVSAQPQDGLIAWLFILAAAIAAVIAAFFLVVAIVSVLEDLGWLTAMIEGSVRQLALPAPLSGAGAFTKLHIFTSVLL